MKLVRKVGSLAVVAMATVGMTVVPVVSAQARPVPLCPVVAGPVRGRRPPTRVTCESSRREGAGSARRGRSMSNQDVQSWCFLEHPFYDTGVNRREVRSGQAVSDLGFGARSAQQGCLPAGLIRTARAGALRTPNRANLARLDAAYWYLRRRNVATGHKHRLNNNGRGTRVEINPVNQTGVEPCSGATRPCQPQCQRPGCLGPGCRPVDVLDAILDTIIEELGSDHDDYSHVPFIGWAA